jgi:hypothetical protein
MLSKVFVNRTYSSWRFDRKLTTRVERLVRLIQSSIGQSIALSINRVVIRLYLGFEMWTTAFRNIPVEQFSAANTAGIVEKQGFLPIRHVELGGIGVPRAGGATASRIQSRPTSPSLPLRRAIFEITALSRNSSRYFLHAQIGPTGVSYDLRA